ncbi:MAG: hypothetical protein E7637_08820 [Ruminococcaceae bacterium]|nr:hypothetical protein [Oscillospiraceae bacterium]
MEEVYVDLYFLINLSMNFLCLMIGATLLHRTARRGRVLLAAAFGGGYALVALLVGSDGVVGLLLDILTVIGMCAIAFGTRKKGVRGLLRAAAVVWLTSMLLGGVMTALYAGLNRLNLPLESLEDDGLSVWVFVAVSALAGILTVKGGRWFGLSAKTKSAILEVTLFGKTVRLRAMIDTGNLLRDPVSGRGVAVTELAAVEKLLPKDLFLACKTGDATAYLSNHEKAKRVRLIPANSAAGSALLLAVVPERVVITVGRESFSSDYLIAPRPLGLDEFDAIIGQ